MFLPGRSWRLQVFGIALAIAAAIVSAQSMASARESAATYLIQPGDSLLQIAGSTGVGLDRLMALNGIKDPDMIIAGKTLQLQAAQQQDQAAATSAPAPAQTAAAPPRRRRARRSTRSKRATRLWDIALATKVTVDALIKANNLDNADKLTVGQQLSVPKPAPKPAPTAASAPTASQAQAAQKPSGLQQKLLAEAQRVGGPNARVGVAAYNLVSGERVTIKGDESFPSASVMKLPILVELERQIAAGTLAVERRPAQRRQPDDLGLGQRCGQSTRRPGQHGRGQRRDA